MARDCARRCDTPRRATRSRRDSRSTASSSIPSGGRVSRDGAPVRLTPKEYDLLVALVRHAGRVITHRQILNEVWGPAHRDDTQYLRVFIGQLRAKIERDPLRRRS